MSESLVQRNAPLELRREAHRRGLAALESLQVTTDPLAKEQAFVELREAVEMESSIASSIADLDLYSIEWKWRLLEELSHDVSVVWAETAVALWRWNGPL